MVPVDRGLERLAPGFLTRLERCLTLLRERGHDPWLFETHRSQERQAWLYAQGRTRPGIIVTRASKASTSWHGYGLAADVIDKTRHWDASPAFWRALGIASRTVGLTWGGDWKSFPDRPHVQWGAMPAGPSAADAVTLRDVGSPAVWQRYGADRATPGGHWP